MKDYEVNKYYEANKVYEANIVLVFVAITLLFSLLMAFPAHGVGGPF